MRQPVIYPRLIPEGYMWAASEEWKMREWKRLGRASGEIDMKRTSIMQ